MKSISETLNDFAKEVIRQARANLTRDDINVSKKLYKDLNFELKVSKNSLRLQFLLGEYGMFRDLGVKGANPSLVKNGVQKAPQSPYKFKTKKPPIDDLLKWVKARRLRLRDSSGRFKRGSQLSLTYIIQNRIFAQGIKPSLFFTKPYKKNFKKLPKELAEAYGLEVQDFVKEAFKYEKI